MRYSCLKSLTFLGLTFKIFRWDQSRVWSGANYFPHWGKTLPSTFMRPESRRPLLWLPATLTLAPCECQELSAQSPGLSRGCHCPSGVKFSFWRVIFTLLIYEAEIYTHLYIHMDIHISIWMYTYTLDVPIHPIYINSSIDRHCYAWH